MIEGSYEKGVKLCGKEKTKLEERLERSELLPMYDISIEPLTVNQHF